MPAQAVTTARKAQYLILELSLPGRPRANAGVLLLDPLYDQLRIRLRPDWTDVSDPEDAEVLTALEQDLRGRSRETGAEALVGYLEDSLSNVLRISARQAIAVSDFDKALDRLYARHVEGEAPAAVEVIPYRTHVPLYSLKAAATHFGGDMEVEAEDWMRAPENLRLTPDMFIAQVVGRSMEPLIPDGSLCVFRAKVVGSRQGKLLLVQQRGASESGGEFTVKRYTSAKTESEEGWRHGRIRLEPLNPEFTAWDLDASELEDGPYRVVAEFVRVLPFEEQY